MSESSDTGQSGQIYTLTYIAGANGSITGISPQTVDYGASGAQVTALPDTGYQFVSWSDGILTTSRTDSNVTGDITVTANFAVSNHGPQTNITGNIYGPIISGNIYFQNWDPNAIKHLAIDIEAYLSIGIQDENFRRLLGDEFDDAPINLFVPPFVKGHDEDDEPLSVLKQIKGNRFTVLLGEPGSGKSTLVNHLAYCIAQKALGKYISNEQKCDHQMFSDFFNDDEVFFPIVIKIRAFMAFMRTQKEKSTGSADDLYRFIKKIFSDKVLGVMPYIDCEARNGHLFLMLDGLDEIRPEERIFVRNVIWDFCSSFYKIRTLVTCRTLNYVDFPGSQPKSNYVLPRKTHSRPNGFVEFELGLFRPDQRENFITLWYQFLENSNKISRSDSKMSKRKLNRAIEGNDGLSELASNPLLLTMMAFVHWKQNELPESRVMLYEAIIKLFLLGWDNQKELESNKGDINFQFLEKALGKLAYEFHNGNGYSDENNERGIRYSDLEEILLKWIKDKKQNLIPANPDITNVAKVVISEIVNTLRERSPLFINVKHSKVTKEMYKADESFVFPHRTFQEYLASLNLSPSYLDIPTIDSPNKPFYKQAIDLIESDIKWHDVILLAVGRFRHILHEPEKSLVLAANLCPQVLSNNDPHRARKNWLAGDILMELELDEIRLNDIGQSISERVRLSLVELLLDDGLSIDERKRVGETLSELGDIRFSNEYWQLPSESCLGFVVIPGEKRNQTVDKSGKTQINKFWVSKYPVTVAQYKLFDQSVKGIDNHPVRNVTKEQALNYCSWLSKLLLEKATEKLSSAALQTEEYDFWNALANESYRVTLPSSEEWEKAASYDGQYEFPWPGEFDARKANLAIDFPAGIRASTTTVGIFHSNPYGLFDICGNVWEWTRSDKNGIHIIRGASFLTFDKEQAKCSFQAEATTINNAETIGFRLTISKG